MIHWNGVGVDWRVALKRIVQGASLLVYFAFNFVPTQAAATAFAIHPGLQTI